MYLDANIQYLYMNIRTLNIALPEDLVKKVDELAKKEYRNRSELIREALRVYLSDKKEWNDILDYGKKIGKKWVLRARKM